ncbi:MAG: DUF2892 domain-containing protein [Deltaproteobacteria bacterium]|jgi:hypothetical protein|nr:DUF2892 domain-containing protein [Deltaproteobacteria bacterium]MBT4527625.1 DUF2892 domain-containing protein [Deltaproteobacteria bacterium]
MKQNIGSLDRLIRMLVGLIIIGAGSFHESWWGAIGLIPITTALLRSCFFYRILKTDTNDKSEDLLHMLSK